MEHRLSDFDYELPPELIAQAPLPERDASRMLIVDRGTHTWIDAQVRDLPALLGPGDCLALNQSRVIPARIFGQSESGARVELFLLKKQGDLVWTALGRPGRRLLPGRTLIFDGGLSAEIVSVLERGERLVRFRGVADDGELLKVLDKIGHIPLPPYIHRLDEPLDRERYQTVFADQSGSAAAPTAGLHFTARMLDQIRERGVEIARVTLHVGLGTFQPVDREDYENHRLHSEAYSISAQDWSAVHRARRVVAVGTTVTRTLETIARTHLLAGETDLFLYPGARFLRVGALLTNFHLPKSSLLLLICAFGGIDLVLDAYRHAVRERYRFFSYGDCMLVL